MVTLSVISVALVAILHRNTLLGTLCAKGYGEKGFFKEHFERLWLVND